MSDAGKAAGVMFLTACGGAAGAVFGFLAVIPIGGAADRLGLAPEGEEALGFLCWLAFLCPVVGLVIGGVVTGLIAGWLAGETRKGSDAQAPSSDLPPRRPDEMPNP